MAVTVSAYNQTAKLFAEGSNDTASVYKVMLCSAATFNAANTTLAGVTKTEITADGYTAGGATVQNVVITTVNTNDAKFDADDVLWTAGSSAVISASYAILYNDSLTGDPPLLFIDFGQIEEAGPTTQFKILWNAAGIFSFTA